MLYCDFEKARVLLFLVCVLFLRKTGMIADMGFDYCADFFLGYVLCCSLTMLFLARLTFCPLFVLL